MKEQKEMKNTSIKIKTKKKKKKKLEENIVTDIRAGMYARVTQMLHVTL